MKRLQAQDRIIERLRAQGLPVPETLRALDGAAALPMAEPGAPPENQAAHVRVLSYLSGDIVPNEEPKSPEFLQAVGATVGRITRALAGFEDEGAKWDSDWHMKNVAAACSARVQYITNPERRALAERYIASYAAALTPEVLAAMPHSVTHCDVNDTNLLFRNGEVVGILDFGDSIYTCTVFDVGIAAGYYSLAQENPLDVFEEVLRGYLSRAPLSDAELEAFFHVAYGRILLSVCFSAQSCTAEPDNEYLAHTSEPGWAVITKLKDVSPADTLERFRRIAAETCPA